ncbi:PAS sensor protein [Halobacteriales archaeon SW_5_70_135]|nr:MAG: PAS sensor protein [Halobacteriales archaeon SW_5_70_135]
MSEGVVFLDDDRRCRHVTRPAAELFGRDRERLVGERLDGDALGDADEFTDCVAAALDGTERTAAWHDPERDRRIEVRAYPADDGAAVHVTDVTERERLRRQRYLFERGQEIVDAGMWEYDPREETIEWSDGAREIHGVDEGYEPTLSEVIEFYHPDDRETIREAVERAVRDGEGYDLRLRLVRADGDRRHVRTVGDPVVDDGQVVYVHGVVGDVTDSEKREQVLAELHDVGLDLQESDTAEEVAQRTVDAAAEVLDLDQSVFFLEEDGVLRVVASPSEMSTDVTKVMSVDEGLVGETFRTGESRLVADSHEYDAVDGEPRYRSAVSVPAGDHGNFQAVATDRDNFDESDLEFAELLVDRARSALDRVERERELRRENDRLEEFASIVSHDIRNPLEVATGRMALLQREIDSEHVDETVAALDRMAEIVDDTLTLARYGTVVGETEPVSLPALARRCWNTVDTGDARLEVDDDLVVRADDDRLRHLLENLFRNAVKHGVDDRSHGGDDEYDPQVTVRVGRSPDEDVLYVEDDGVGVPPAERETVFELGHSSADDGTGFGLTIVDRIAESHGWDARVVEGRDGGARFEFAAVEFVT